MNRYDSWFVIFCYKCEDEGEVITQIGLNTNNYGSGGMGYPDLSPNNF